MRDLCIELVLLEWDLCDFHGHMVNAPAMLDDDQSRWISEISRAELTHQLEVAPRRFTLFRVRHPQ